MEKTLSRGRCTSSTSLIRYFRISVGYGVVKPAALVAADPGVSWTLAALVAADPGVSWTLAALAALLLVVVLVVVVVLLLLLPTAGLSLVEGECAKRCWFLLEPLLLFVVGVLAVRDELDCRGVFRSNLLFFSLSLRCLSLTAAARFLLGLLLLVKRMGDAPQQRNEH